MLLSIYFFKKVNDFVFELKACVTSKGPYENNCLSALKMTGTIYLVVKGCYVASVLQTCVYLCLRRYYTKPICFGHLQN